MIGGIGGYLYFAYVIIHGDVVIIIRLLVSIIGKFCSRLSRGDNNLGSETKIDEIR